MDLITKDKLAEVRRLNDQFRTTFRGGEIYLTHGVATLPTEIVASALMQVAEYDSFTEKNDPHGEHSVLSFKLCNRTFVFVIQCWDLELNNLSSDPADPKVTRRVGILYLKHEW